MAWLFSALLIGSILVGMQAQDGCCVEKKAKNLVRLEQLLQSSKAYGRMKELEQALTQTDVTHDECVLICQGVRTACNVACLALPFPAVLFCEGYCIAAGLACEKGCPSDASMELKH